MIGGKAEFMGGSEDVGQMGSGEGVAGVLEGLAEKWRGGLADPWAAWRDGRSLFLIPQEQGQFLAPQSSHMPDKQPPGKVTPSSHPTLPSPYPDLLS